MIGAPARSTVTKGAADRRGNRPYKTSGVKPRSQLHEPAASYAAFQFTASKSKSTIPALAVRAEEKHDKRLPITHLSKCGTRV